MASLDSTPEQPSLWFAESKDETAAEEEPATPTPSIVASTQQAVAARLHTAMTALEELSAQIAGHPAFVSVTEKTAKVVQDLRESAAAHKARGYSAFESVPEQPMVKNALERLNQATEVLGRVKAAAKDRVLSSTVTQKVGEARERAVAAVADARTVVAQLPSNAKSFADSSARFFVAKAAQVDRRFGVHEYAASFADKVKLEDKASRATTLLQAGDERLGVSKTVTRFAPGIANSSAAYFNRTVDYLMSLKSHYLAVREGDKDYHHHHLDLDLDLDVDAEPGKDTMASTPAVECM